MAGMRSLAETQVGGTECWKADFPSAADVRLPATQRWSLKSTIMDVRHGQKQPICHVETDSRRSGSPPTPSSP